MKREILFRGKQSNTGEWVYGMFITIRNVFDDEDTKEKTMFIDSQWIAGCEAIGECWVEVNPETVGQFTGLTDKNGKKIFEGDIIKFIDDTTIPDSPTECITDVFWWNEMQRFSLKNTYHELNWLEVEEMEIVGNIHDNPELLK